MARRPRYCPAGIAQHVVQRGNNRQVCFVDDEDRAALMHWLAEAAHEAAVSIHAWVLMTNHFHLLVTPADPLGVSVLMQRIGRQYVRYFNHRYGRSGTLWEGRFRSSAVQSDHYLLAAQRYIELNPVRAGMVDHPGEYHWSSYHAHANGLTPACWTPHPTFLALSSDPDQRRHAYRQMVDQALPERTIREIRQASTSNIALGNDRFRDEIERLTGIRQRLAKPGPKPKG